MHRAMLGLSPSTVILPESLAQPTQSLLEAYGALDGSTLPCSMVPLAPGTALPHKGGLKSDPGHTSSTRLIAHRDAC